MSNTIPETHLGWPPTIPVTRATEKLSGISDDEAYRQGWWAYGFGSEPTDNPYGTLLIGREWDRGWHDAETDNGG